jgi:cellulose synthase/poly-beta-1,6-N-acetylglucosamine synthase-like glycosyltransferase
METVAPLPLISVIIPTFNRADLLQASLESLANQTLPKHCYEIIVVDDGSTDGTRELCQAFSLRVRLKYLRIDNSGISAAKNLGIFASRGSILLFFDDDDIADRNLLLQHLKSHESNAGERIAVLGYTTWAPSLPVTEVMNYITEIGHFLFSYSDLKEGQTLDYTYFWGGRSSCKRSLLVKHGVFNQKFRFGSEDIELGYRLTKFGLKVIFNRKALQYMNRPVTYHEFCRRCEKQGVSQYMFSQLHAEPEIQQYCQVIDADSKWHNIEQTLEEKISRVGEIERLLGSQSAERSVLLDELWGLYRFTFNAFKVKGIIETRAVSYQMSCQFVERLKQFTATL